MDDKTTTVPYTVRRVIESIEHKTDANTITAPEQGHTLKDFIAMTDEEIRKSNYIVLYADEFDRDVWQGYCDACGVPYSSVEITIWFKKDDVETVDGEEEE